MIKRIWTGIKRIWIGNRAAVIAISMVAVLAIVFASLVAAYALRSTAQATPTARSSFAGGSPSQSGSPTPLPSASGTFDNSPTPLPSGWSYSDLDGVAAPADLAHRLPIAVMVDDNAVARPQSGFSSASIVYQAMADGGEDRYMLIFQEGTATDIGPARSTRPYFVYWATEYKPLFGHIGGDAESLQQVIPAMANAIYNEDELNGGYCPWHRISTRASPHNDYTNSADLISCAAKQGYPSTYQGLPTRTFVDGRSAALLPASQSITIPYRTGTIAYQFDPNSDTYLRSVDGELQTDAANGEQVSAADVVVMFQSYAMVSGLDEMRPAVGMIGSGDAIVFREGMAIVGTWRKSSTTALTRFYDSSGAEIPLRRGEIFIQSVPIGTAVTYK